MIDRERELVALFQQEDSFLGCQDATLEVGTIDIQRVERPDGSLASLVQRKDQVTAVYDIRDGLTFSCAFFTGASGKMIALGISDLVSTDNDVTLSGDRTNAFGFRVSTFRAGPRAGLPRGPFRPRNGGRT